MPVHNALGNVSFTLDIFVLQTFTSFGVVDHLGPIELKTMLANVLDYSSGVDNNIQLLKDTTYLSSRIWRNQTGSNWKLHPYRLGFTALEDSMNTTDGEKES